MFLKKSRDVKNMLEFDRQKLNVVFKYKNFFSNTLSHLTIVRHYSANRFRVIAGKARCEYPGEPLNGRIIPLKFWYGPGDKLKITCLAGYVLPLPLEASPPVCLNDGTWSHSLPECIRYTNV